MSEHAGRCASRVLAAALASVVCMAAAAAVGAAAGRVGAGTALHYSALGDSYSSGVGTRSYLDDGTDCERSPYAYPERDARTLAARLDFRACGGATSLAVDHTQLGGLNDATSIVTVSAGGNDAGFSGIIRECAEPAWVSDCSGAVEKGTEIVRDQLPGRLDTLYADIAARAPHATRLIAVGYPYLFNGEDCNAGTFFSPADETAINHGVDLIDSTIAAQAARYGFLFADPRTAFAGHAVCGHPEWINGLSDPIGESYHPNRDGQSGYASLVGALLR